MASHLLEPVTLLSQFKNTTNPAVLVKDLCMTSTARKFPAPRVNAFLCSFLIGAAQELSTNEQQGSRTWNFIALQLAIWKNSGIHLRKGAEKRGEGN